MSTQKHKEQPQSQGSGHQEQKQGLPPDPVQEQRQAYSVPENAIASDPITEAPKAEPEKKPEEKKQ